MELEKTFFVFIFLLKKIKVISKIFFINVDKDIF